MDQLIPTEGLCFVGNGRVAMASEGADILQLFAPCYSLPGMLTLKLTDDTLQANKFRMAGTAGYVTKVCDAAGEVLGEILDYTHPTEPVFIRRLRLSVPLTFSLESSFEARNTDALWEGHAKARLFEIPDGTVVFSKSKTDKETFCQLLLSPSCVMEEGSIRFPAGDSRLMLVGGAHGASGRESFVNCMELSRRVLSLPLDDVLADFSAHWRRIFDGVTVDRTLLASIPDGEELLEAVTAALVTQTSAEGGVIAGAFYHLAYGRDMYGVFRGYMALGLHSYARRMVEYMAEIYRQKGFMPNASGMGMSCSHCHENDDVEQTGYYLLELVTYAEETGDLSFLRDRMDYARYLLEAQEAQLCRGMIPFNGDETYIAGGIFPRGGIDHGSMEATALYIGSAYRLLALCEAHGLMDAATVAAHRQVADSAARAFADHFTDGDEVYINNPRRTTAADTPPYRHGVCHACLHMTWLIRTPEGGYLCPSCFGHASAPVTTETYSTDCALWMAVFARCSRLDASLVRVALERSVCAARASRFGEATTQNVVGYEYGVMLYALAETLPKEALSAYRDVLDALLEDRVRGSVWTEYYREGKPSLASCPYRPWESAINLCGILAYLNALRKGE